MPTLDGDGRVWGFQTKLSTTQHLRFSAFHMMHIEFLVPARERIGPNLRIGGSPLRLSVV